MGGGHGHTELDSVLHAIGPTSRFAVLQCFIYFLTYVWDAFQLFNIVFIGQDVEHTCAPPTNGSDVIIPELHGNWSNVTVNYGKCAITVVRNFSGEPQTSEYPCLYGMEYDQPKEFSIVSQYDLVCDRALLTGLSQSLLSLGGGLGSAVLPAISDRFGRQRCIVVCFLLAIPCGIVAGLAQSYELHTAMKFIVGFTMPGIGVTAFTATVELFPSSHRPLANILCSGLWWGLCLSSVAPFAYLLRFESWRILQIASSCAWGVLVIPIIIFASEPLRWLVANNQINRAVKVLKQAARWNGVDVQAILDVFLGAQPTAGEKEENGHSVLINDDFFEMNGEEIDKNTKSYEEKEKSRKLCPSLLPKRKAKIKKEAMKLAFREDEKLGFKDLICNKHLRTNTIVSLYIWFTHSWIYFALMLMSASLAGSLYLNFFLNSLVEGFACVVGFLLLTRLQRRKTIAGFLVIAGLGLIASSVCLHFEDQQSHLKTVATVFALCGKFGIGASFNTVFMYTPEMFPTNIRNRALGLTLVASTVGSMVAPYSGSLSDIAIWLPGVMFGACAFLAAPLMFLLPETMGRELPQTIGDLEEWYKTPCSSKEFEVKAGAEEEATPKAA